MATHSSILAWRIPMDRRAWQATVQGRKESTSLTHPPDSSHSLGPYYPGFSDYRHPSRLLPPAPPLLPHKRPLPRSHRRCYSHCTDENGEARVG